MALVTPFVLTGPAPVQAHGGVPIDEDRCVFRLAGKRIHFTAYQPRRIGDSAVAETLCRKLPETTGVTYFALDLVDEPLRKLPLYVEITPLGSGEEDTGLSPVVDLDMGIKPLGVVSFKHDFHGARGRYRVDVIDQTDHTRGSFVFEVGARERKWVRPVLAWLFTGTLLGGLALLGQRAWRQRKS